MFLSDGPIKLGHRKKQKETWEAPRLIPMT
jgi:hypothetical protein